MTDHTELKRLAEGDALIDLSELENLCRSFFPERLSVDYWCQRTGLDDENLLAFLMHGPKDDGDYVCVDEEPDSLDGPPSPRLEAIAQIINTFPRLCKELARVREANDRLLDEVERLKARLEQAEAVIADAWESSKHSDITEDFSCPHCEETHAILTAFMEEQDDSPPNPNAKARR
jgi:hypothetical protein